MRRIVWLILIYQVVLKASFGSAWIDQAFQDSYKLESRGAYRKAYERLLPLESSLKHNYFYNVRMAWLSSLVKNYQVSIRYYTQASIILPNSFEPRLGLARVYLLLSKPTLAAINAKIVLKTDPLNYYGNLYLARSLQQLKQKELAIQIVERLLGYYPSSKDFIGLYTQLKDKANSSKAKKRK